MKEGTETGSGRRSVSFGHPPPQSEADELVPAGLQEVLDVFFPDFRGPGEPFREADPFGGGPERRRRRRRLDDDVPVQRVHLALDAAVRVLAVLLLVPGVVVLERVPLVVRVQAVLLHQRLRGARGKTGVT